jgi:hypothetical protein
MIDYVSIREKMARTREGTALPRLVSSFANVLKYNKLNKQ